jgi:hypothetical protein
MGNALGGEPLWCVPEKPAEILPGAALSKFPTSQKIGLEFDEANVAKS